jgi:hypothetical protein
MIKRNLIAADEVYQSELNRLIREITEYADKGIQKLQLNFTVCTQSDGDNLIKELKKLNLIISNIMISEIFNTGICYTFLCFIR